MDKILIDSFYSGKLEEFKKLRKKSKQETLDDIWIKELVSLYNTSKKLINEENAYQICKHIETCECSVPYKFIIDSSTDFKFDPTYSYMNKCTDDFNSVSELLNFIVLASRNIIYNENNHLLKIPHKIGIDAMDLSGMCYDCSKAVEIICNNLNIENKIIRIDPGFDRLLNLMDGWGYHYFNIVTINNKNYLIDLSYIQFFDINGCLLEKNGIYQRYGSSPGIYMVINEKRKKVAKTILSDSYIELTEDNMKAYFDGFSIAYRNAIYYEHLGVLDFSTNYTANDYESFIYGDDSQANHENINELGIQRIFIKNPKIEFKTDMSLIKD